MQTAYSYSFSTYLTILVIITTNGEEETGQQDMMMIFIESPLAKGAAWLPGSVCVQCWNHNTTNVKSAMSSNNYWILDTSDQISTEAGAATYQNQHENEVKSK